MNEMDEGSSLRSSEPSAAGQDTCGVCGKAGIQYQPFSGGKEYYCPSCEDVHPYEPGQAPRRAQMIQDGRFAELKQEMRDHLRSFDNPSARVSAVEGGPCDGGKLVDWESLPETPSEASQEEAQP